MSSESLFELFDISSTVQMCSLDMIDNYRADGRKVADGGGGVAAGQDLLLRVGVRAAAAASKVSNLNLRNQTLTSY